MSDISKVPHKRFQAVSRRQVVRALPSSWNAEQLEALPRARLKASQDRIQPVIGDLETSALRLHGLEIGARVLKVVSQERPKAKQEGRLARPKLNLRQRSSLLQLIAGMAACRHRLTSGWLLPAYVARTRFGHGAHTTLFLSCLSRFWIALDAYFAGNIQYPGL